MIGLYTHATGCFVRDSAEPSYSNVFPFYTTKNCLGYESWRYTIWPGILYFGERMWREYRARRATRLSKVLVHPSGMFSHIPFANSLRPSTLGAMELRIVKPSFKYTAGQWLFIMVPEISGWQWHPVSGSLATTYLHMLIQGSLPSHRLRKILMSPFTFAKSVTGRGLSVNVSVLAHKSSLP